MWELQFQKRVAQSDNNCVGQRQGIVPGSILFELWGTFPMDCITIDFVKQANNV